MNIRENFGKPIDPRIRPLVEAMNIPDVCETIASCEGHRNGWLTGEIRPPYVYFKGDDRFVSILNRIVYGDSCLARPRLNYYWHIRGMFNGENALCFYLSPPRFTSGPGLSARFTWSRSGLDADIGTLLEMVRSAHAEWAPAAGQAGHTPDTRHVAGGSTRKAPLKHAFGDLVEPHILPLVESLNIPGVCETVASREGARVWNLKYLWPPALITPDVFFRASIHFAAIFDRLIHEALYRDPPVLHFSWRLQALDEHRRYLLSSPHFGRGNYSPSEIAWRWPETRAKLDQDFMVLADLATQALSHWRQDGEPEVEQSEAGQGGQQQPQGNGPRQTAAPGLLVPLSGTFGVTGLGRSAKRADQSVLTDVFSAVPTRNKRHPILPMSGFIRRILAGIRPATGKEIAS